MLKPDIFRDSVDNSAKSNVEVSEIKFVTNSSDTLSLNFSPIAIPVRTSQRKTTTARNKDTNSEHLPRWCLPTRRTTPQLQAMDQVRRNLSTCSHRPLNLQEAPQSIQSKTAPTVSYFSLTRKSHLARNKFHHSLQSSTLKPYSLLV